MKYLVHVAVDRESSTIQPQNRSSLRQYLSAAESAQLQRKTSLRQQTEFLLSRWLAKKLGVEAGLAFSLDNLETISSTEGRPKLVEISSQKIFPLSISHRFPSVAVAICPQLPIGIDIEKIPVHDSDQQRDRWLESLLNVAFRDDESFLVRKSKDGPSDLVLRWTIKESVAKAASRVGLVNLASISTGHIAHELSSDPTEWFGYEVPFEQTIFQVVSCRTADDEWTSVATVSTDHEISYRWNGQLLSITDL